MNEVYDSPDDVARLVGSLARPTLLVFDCDGVLAPITDHAADSELTPGVGDDLVRLATTTDVSVAILSGRSLDGLAQFGFHDALTVSASYGVERRGGAIVELTPAESDLLARLDGLLGEAADMAGPGAWIERKPTSVVVHVREADSTRAREALDWASHRQSMIDGHTCHPGDMVLELMARSADKGTALDALRADHVATTCVYVGDDIPDEAAFARLGADDIGIKIGPGESAARRRLHDPAAVAVMLHALVRTVGSEQS